MAEYTWTTPQMALEFCSLDPLKTRFLMAVWLLMLAIESASQEGRWSRSIFNTPSMVGHCLQDMRDSDNWNEEFSGMEGNFGTEFFVGDVDTIRESGICTGYCCVLQYLDQKSPENLKRRQRRLPPGDLCMFSRGLILSRSPEHSASGNENNIWIAC